jgi:TolB protein
MPSETVRGTRHRASRSNSLQAVSARRWRWPLLAMVFAVGLLLPGYASAAFPGANGQIAFVSDRSGNRDIYVMNADGSGVRQLTSNLNPSFYYAEFPDWSADGKQIAFDVNSRTLYAVNDNGGGLTALTNDASIVHEFPSWAPDRKKVAFSSNLNGFLDVYTMNADGSSPQQLTYGDADIYPAWSPDGTKIAFQRGVFGNIYVMNPDGSEQKQVTDTFTDELPTWSPDGTKIAFDSSRSGNNQIYVMNADGSGLIRVTNDSSTDWGAAWSPDGTKIAFASNLDGHYQIYAVKTDGSGLTRLTNDAANDLEPSWQPVVASDTTPPLIEVPSAITGNATSPGGGVVHYDVSATDPDDVASVNCVPASGSTFPIGTTTVTCLASDTHGNTSSASFPVHIKGAAEQLADLLSAVTGLGPGASLADKVSQVQASVDANKLTDACSTLTALVNQLKAVSGKSIPSDQAMTHITTALRIKSVLGC